MQSQRAASTNGRAPSAGERANARSELDRLRVTCRRQARTIDALGEAIAVLRNGAGVLNAENAELRAAALRTRDHPGVRAPAGAEAQDAELTEVRLTLDARAPAAARAIVASRLRDRWPAPVLERAQLLTSELVTNSVLHSDAPADASMVFRLELSQDAIRLEVEDPGGRGAVAPRSPDLDGGGGFGLNLVQQLSERWGVERVAAGGTRVWAQTALGSSAECLDTSEAQALSPAYSARVRPSIGALELFPLPGVAPLAGRVVHGDELDKASSDVLANAIAAFSDGRDREIDAARASTEPRFRRPLRLSNPG
jgi:serine/threonine-protein kinase RsbW